MKQSSSWLPLRPGDGVDMVAPGMAFDWSYQRQSEQILKSWGFHVDYPKNIIGSHPVSSNTREFRFAHFQKALLSENRVIWAARGGYGSLHFLSLIKKLKKPRCPKLLIGFSDGCTLHHFLNQEWGWPTLHGPHVDRICLLNSTRQKELLKIITGKISELSYSLRPMNQAARRTSGFKSVVTGGNLITTQSTLGTPWQIETDGKILFLEEIGERGYRVDRALEHLHLAGALQKTKAVVFGPFVGGDEPQGPSRTPKVLKDFAERMKFPVYQGIASGHIPNSLSLPMNTAAYLQKKGARFLLTVKTGVADE